MDITEEKIEKYLKEKDDWEILVNKPRKLTVMYEKREGVYKVFVYDKKFVDIEMK